MRKTLNITQIGEGSRGRKIGHYADGLGDPYFWLNAGEAKGVFFRLGPVAQYADVQLIFSPELLNQYPDYIFNTEENCGFAIGEDGVNGESPFSGEPMTSYWGRVPPKSVLKTLRPGMNEILIPGCVNLDNLVAIKFVKENMS